MKKKNLRQQREEAKKQRIAAYAEKAKAEAETSADENAVKAEISEKTTSEKSKKKSLVKAAGLKSAFVVGDSVYLTSFGKGNAARLDTKINSDNSTERYVSGTEKHTLKINSITDTELRLSGPFPKQAEAKNPTHKKDNEQKNTRQDMLGLKSTLEKFYFGSTFDDNIHIQIIHNIQDIAKILAVHSNNVGYALDNMLAYQGVEFSDMIGYMGTSRTFDNYDPNHKNNKDFFRFLKLPRLGYFGSAFYSQKGKNFEKRSDEEIYNICALMGQTRHCCFHGEQKKYQLKWLYNFWNYDHIDAFLDTLDKHFDEMLDRINKGFVKTNTPDLIILSGLYPDMPKKELVRLFYDFTTVKEYKNMGFSVKKLREKMLENEETSDFKDKKNDSDRRKLYKLMDFCIFYLYYSDSKRNEDLVSRLRESLTDENKDIIYSKEAKTVWNELRKKFSTILDNVKGANIKKLEDVKEKFISEDEFDDIKLDIDISYFSKLMYVMCYFLDGKEINDLLTTLVSKFDNIGSIIEAAKQIGIKIEFIEDLKFFDRSKKISGELNIIRNFARMQKPVPNAKRAMQEDAIRILGGSEEDISSILDDMTGYDKSGKKLAQSKKGFRNFIINNVVESSRFKYIVRYSNPQKIRKLANNSVVVGFVLGKLPDAQIESYFNSCLPNRVYSTPDKARESLRDRLHNISFNDFADVKQDARPKSEENVEKERYKAIIGLYLTVMYHLVKNLVYVNSRYVMAFHCLERDAMHYDVSLDNYRDLIRHLISEGDNSCNHFISHNKRMRGCIEENVNNSEQLIFGKEDAVIRFRNNVAHLSAIRNANEYIGDIREITSYFALYHYLMQRKLIDDCKVNDTAHKYFEQLTKYKTYVMDMVKALCSPFGYNLPRFKNLSIEGKFDMHESQ